MLETAIQYLSAGLSVLPASLSEKRPALAGWKQYQQRLPTEQQVRSWFSNTDAVCVIAGSVSGNLEMIDFDNEGELFDAWLQLVESEAPAIAARIAIETSQSGGRHVIYRSSTNIPGNQKLAQRVIETSSAEPIEIAGKRYVPRRQNGRFEIQITLIETRGQGGIFLCDPTPGYQLQQGSLIDLPTFSDGERAILIEAAKALNESSIAVSVPGACSNEGRPGDEFNESGDVRDVLVRNGWTLAKAGTNEYWRRPGKEQGWSATLRERVLYVFSSNAHPFEADRAYSPFSVFALLEHDGDFGAAALGLRQQGYGNGINGEAVDLSSFLRSSQADDGSTGVQAAHPNPGPVPNELLRIPGFVSDVMDHCLATAPYPNVALAFCGALALQATLAGRKVRDHADNRTNIYLLALAYSSVGKDWPRKINTHIMHRVGLVNALGEKFASGEGIQDSLFLTPAMLFQTDEIDGLLQSINKARDARHENILGTLLTMYSAANSIYPMRRKAGKESPGVIDQPCLVVYGTAIPTHYYGALSERMLTNGFFARMLIVESGPRSLGQEPGIIDPPTSVMEAATWWSEFNPGSGNLESWHPEPLIVPVDESARQALIESREQADGEYANAESHGDPVGTTVWGRVHEQTRKLALLYAVSENYSDPTITFDAVRWASEFVTHQTRRMLFMAHDHVSENPFHGDCLKLIKKLREAPEQTLPHSVLLKRMKMDSKTFQTLIETLLQQGDVEIQSVKTTGRTGVHYRLAGERSNRGETSSASVAN